MADVLIHSRSVHSQILSIEKAFPGERESRIAFLQGVGIDSEPMPYVLALKGINDDAVAKGLISAEFCERIKPQSICSLTLVSE